MKQQQQQQQQQQQPLFHITRSICLSPVVSADNVTLMSDCTDLLPWRYGLWQIMAMAGEGWINILYTYLYYLLSSDEDTIKCVSNTASYLKLKYLSSSCWEKIEI